MSLLHTALYETDNFETICVERYLSMLCDYLTQAYHLKGKNILIKCNIKTDLSFKMDLIHNLGLIINEAITNAIQHAFLNRNSGQINVSLHVINRVVSIKVIDNGIGLSTNQIDFSRVGLGLKLMSLLAKQMNAKLVLSNQNGTCIHLQFNL